MRNFILATLLVLGANHFLAGQSGIKINRWITGVSIPVDIGHCGDDRIFVIEKVGRIRIIRNNALTTTPFLDITAKVRATGGEQGLLGMAFHPDFKTNGLLYVNYTDRATQTKTVIEEYKITADSNRIDSTSGRILLTIVQPFSNHNGGCIKFGPDGYLYIGMGDGGSANDPQNNSQTKMALLGKMLRIDVNTSPTYKIPSSNPFVGNTSYAPEIWSMGLRNPWRFSFDRMTGDLWIGDVGQGNWEEIDFEAANDPGGKNYGWRCYEGNANFNTTGCEAKANYTFPIHEYLSDENINGCSVTGGYVYRGSKYPGLFGKYIYGDYCSGKIWTLERRAGNTAVNTLVYDHSNNSITTFGEDAEGNLYFADASASAIYQISDTCSLRILLNVEGISCAGINDARVSTNVSSNPDARFLWSTGDTSATLENLAPGKYNVAVTIGNCLSSSSFEVFDKIKDTACITPPFRNSFCEGDSTVLIACDARNVFEYRWYLDGIELPIKDKRLWIFKAGTYRVDYIDSFGCIAERSEQIDVIVFPKPPKPSLRVSRDSVYSDAGYSSYRWFHLGNFTGSSTAPYWWANGADGEYRVEVVDSNGCHSELSDPVTVVIPATGNPNQTPHHIEIFPHPVSKYLRFTASMKFNQWKILNIQSQIALTGKIESVSKQEFQLDISSLKTGTYVLELSDGKQHWKKIFMKQ
ncbi:MAG: PQQ-dependent sugar dehydrogenase [Saprospiraceae bacterium]|nr:PQQ-dependent sugar dehydrogenase [Saprospiraceae bacterium]